MAVGQVINQHQQLQHVLAVPLPAQGHLNPLMRFCQMLVKHPGFIITFVDFDPIHALLQQVRHDDHDHHHADHTPEADNNPPLIRRACIPLDGLDFSNNFNMSFRDILDTLPSMAPYLEELILSLNRQGPAVTCLLSDFFVTLPTQDVADKLCIPRIALYPCCATRLLFNHYFSQEEYDSISLKAVIEALAIGPTKRGEVFSQGLPGLPTLYYEDIPHLQHVVDDTQRMCEINKKLWQICNARAYGVVVNSFMDLEKPSFEALSKASNVPIYDVGFWAQPLLEDNATSLWKEDTSCMSWLDKQPTTSVLYISFGSITLLSRSQLEEFEDGLISSGQRFLWVFRTDLVLDIDHRSYVAHIMSRSNGKGFVINWAPQLKVLSHPSVGGFLTHCGWNSTTESISNGVPMLCWPYFGDQPLNARCIMDEWKVGLGFKVRKEAEGNSFTQRDEVERAIRALMEGKEGRVIQQNATRLKKKSYECLLESGSSMIKLKALVMSLLNYNRM